MNQDAACMAALLLLDALVMDQLVFAGIAAPALGEHRLICRTVTRLLRVARPDMTAGASCIHRVQDLRLGMHKQAQESAGRHGIASRTSLGHWTRHAPDAGIDLDQRIYQRDSRGPPPATPHAAGVSGKAPATSGCKIGQTPRMRRTSARASTLRMTLKPREKRLAQGDDA
jgi:hypothetical protein